MTKQYIDLTASNKKKVANEATKGLTSKGGATIPRVIRKKMEKTSSVVTPDRSRVINHYASSSVEIKSGNKMKGLGKGEYKIERPNTPKKLREANKAVPVKKVTSRKKG